MTIGPAEDVVSVPPRRLPYWGFALVIVIYLVIIQFGGRVIGSLADEDDTVSTRGVVVTMIIPLGLALVFVYAVVAYLRWWRPVLRDDRPVRRWVWVVPALMAVAIALGIDYGALADKGMVFVLVLLVATQFVGWGEEGLFRGVGVTVLREHGLTEGRVAVVSSVIFGAVHLTNALGSGATAIPQAIAVSLAGYFFYLTRRVSGSNTVNSVLHGLFDFSLLSGSAISVGQGGYLGSVAPILVYPILALILVAKRRDLQLHRASPEGR